MRFVSPRLLVALLALRSACSIATGTLPTTAGKLAVFRTEAPAKASHPATRTNASQSAYPTNEQLRTFTGVIGSGPQDGESGSQAVARCGDDAGATGKESRQTTCANHKRWRITGSGRLLPISYKLRWIVWRSTPSNPRYCASFLQRWGTIRLSSRNVLPGPC